MIMSATEKKSIRQRLIEVTGCDIGDVHPEFFITEKRGEILPMVERIGDVMFLKFYARSPAGAIRLSRTSYN